MKVLAFEKEVPGATDKDYATHLKAESIKVWELYQADVIREVYFRRDLPAAVLVLECTGLPEAEQILSTMPLVKEGLITFELVPLRPYPGFERLFAD